MSLAPAAERVTRPAIRLPGLACAFVATLGIGLTELRAQGDASSEAKNAGAIEPSWTRTIRDSFRLEKLFAAHFGGSVEEAVAGLDKELSAAGIELPPSVKLELRPDKSVLMVEFANDAPEKVRRNIEQRMPRFLADSGWWRDEAAPVVESGLARLIEESKKQRLVVEQNAADAMGSRVAGGILDPDPEGYDGEPSIDPTSQPGGGAKLDGRALKADQMEKMAAYTNAKNRYIQSRKVLESAELTFSAERMKRIPGRTGPDAPSVGAQH